jgi:hypothetical protein
MRMFVLTFAALVACACDAQYRALTAEYRDTIAATAEDQLAVNLARMAANPLAIPNQIQLGNSSATVGGSGTLSASPAVAFRAIAVTGLGVSGTSNMSQQMSIAPVINHIDLRQLQLLLAHALPDYRDGRYGSCEAASRSTHDLENALWQAAFPLSPRSRPAGLPLSGTLGPLPDGCLVLVEPADSCAGNLTRVQLGAAVICFRHGATRTVNNRPQELSSTELRSLLALWTIAIPLVDDKAMAELAAAQASPPAPGRRPSVPPDAGRSRAMPAPISQRRITPPSIFVVPSTPQ